MSVLKKAARAAKAAAERINSRISRREQLASDERAEAYIGEAVKILIAVVIGALLLTLAYALMKDTVFPAVAAKITDLFNYSA
ncbi:MAG: hypothetical protein ILO42_07720 [Clostridia bacterium]|nr:hypothetical protein [Clostridia bacterium]